MRLQKKINTQGRVILEIEKEAAKLLINVMLSCQCPVSTKAEKEIVQYYQSQISKPYLDFKQIINFAEESADETVFHRLRDFCLCFKKNADTLVITKEDVYRHFCSPEHWKIAEGALIEAYTNKKGFITDVPAWLIGHMLLPVKLKQEKNEAYAEYSSSNFNIKILNLFIPSELKIKEDTFYSIHFASIISEITSTESKMINRQLETIDSFIKYRKETKLIDYNHFQKYGNYKRICEKRYNTYFS
jgi:TusA-related sulfurtransferase